MIEFEYVRDSLLPKLAWLARIVRGSDRVRVLHGPDVETGPEFFFEGAWPAPFEEGGFLDAPMVLGSGARREVGAVVFTTASHTLERLHLLQLGDELLVSNSLPFCLAQAGDAPDPAYPFYLHDLSGVTRGVRRAPTQVPTRAGRVVKLVYYTNLRVDRALRCERSPKATPGEFDGFESYYRFLVETTRALAENAASRARTRRYRLVSTISTGYDSPACAVIAREGGCRETVTIRTAREEAYAGAEDSGAEIARFLDMKVSEFEQGSYRALHGFPEAEFLAGGTGGGDMVMACMEEALSGALLFTGFLGDTVWGLADPDPVESRELVFRYPAGIALHEFRLRTGFIHVPLPQAHQPSHPSIQRISVSGEMAPWTLGTDYDRPIARRIVEGAGVPRESFGCSKKAVTQPIFEDTQVDAYLSPGSRRDFERFLAEISLPTGMAEIYLGWMHRLHRLNRSFSHRAVVRLGLPRSHVLARVWISDHHSRPPSKAFFLFHWAVDRLLGRYRGQQEGKC